ncbi:MAG TPA: [protein-PII] uridylyltransferase [Candidatus Binataceae bacterium]|nr:[protein-PII] uridylyltransferase [Candidatus Binataceae bacterium]
MSAAAPNNPNGATPTTIPRGEEALYLAFEETRAPGKVARAYLDAMRAESAEHHFAGASGTEVVREYTAANDDLMRALFRYADAEHARHHTKLNQKLCVVARGGYGRAELNPYSDIDLLFIHDYKLGPYAEIVTEIMLHALWDAGLIVGHGIRNARECVRMAGTDLKEKTAILDARFLAGDSAIYSQLQGLLVADVLNRNQQKFFQAKLEETRERHAKYGDSIYLLEPQLKEGEGGLRDLHTALWLAKVKYKIHTIEELVQRAVITQPELAEVLEARDFLFRVRNSLHFLSKRHFDQLTFEYQERIAPVMGFKPEGPLSASAILMRTYYQHASTILRFSEGLIARVVEGNAGRIGRRLLTRQIRPGVVIQQNLLAISDPELFKRDPLNLMTIYADCQAHGVGLSGSAYQAVRDNLPLLDNDAMRADPRVGAGLMTILSGNRSRVAETLEAMHRSGVLGAIVPEFGNLYARVLHDLYHIYTVDRHSLAAVRELEKLRSGEFKQNNALLTEVARELDSLPLVFLALLLHDIGKGHGHDHHERGAVLTADVCRRLGLHNEQIDLVVFLVREHLAMSQVAQKGDIDDPATVDDFAHEVGSIDRLKALYLLTFADMRAVAPNVYNNWRDMLLSELYMRALRILEHGHHEAVDPDRRLAAAKEDVRTQLRKIKASPDEVERFLDEMPNRYFFTLPDGDTPMHFELMRALGDNALVTRHRHFTDLEFSEFTVVTRDRPGLFSMIAGALTANNLNILSARITTRNTGIALDVFRISHSGPTGAVALEEDRWQRVERDLERVITGKQDIAELVASAHHVRSADKKFVKRVATEVTVENRTSDRYTVIDVFTQDRVGLLFAITYTLFKLDLRIHLARITTNADQALDVFYVSDRAGNKITDITAQRELREKLLERLEDRPVAEGVAAPS